MADDAATRFTGYARAYDAARPHPPAAIAELVTQWAGTAEPDVVDVGAGTGLSTVLWSGRAATVTALEPAAGMREVAIERVGGLPDATRFTVRDASAEVTGLPDECADIVTASQALHWFDADRALPEIARILRPGGVFAAYDCQWPPTVHPLADAAYTEADRLIRAAEVSRGLRPPYAAKQDHLRRLRESGLFRFATEVAVHSVEPGDADRLVALARSQGGAVALAAAGVLDSELGLTELATVAAAAIPATTPFWWTYRVHLAVR